MVKSGFELIFINVGNTLGIDLLKKKSKASVRSNILFNIKRGF